MTTDYATHQEVSPEPETVSRPAGSGPSAAAARLSQTRQRFDPRDKSPGLAAFLSFAPGMGQVYIGYYARGACIAFSVVALFTAADAVGGNVQPLFVFAALFTWAFGIIDAGRLAALYNHAAAGAGSIEMPRDFEMPSVGGSVGGGVLLLVLGLIALSNTALGWSLDWLENWWPLLPTGIGAYLVARAFLDRR